MHVGIAIPQHWDRPRQSVAELRRFLSDVDQGEFHSVWVQEQLLGRDQSFEPLALLAFAASCTTRVRLGSAGIVAPLRGVPALAKAFATIDQLSLGRLDAGIVIGEMPSVFAATGVPWEGRGERFEDCIVAMRSLWTQPQTTRSSQFTVFEAAEMTPRPVQPGGPPLWIGAKRERSLDRVARLADGWLGAGGSGLEEWKTSKRMLDAAIIRHGRPIKKAKKVYLWVDRDERAAVAALGAWFGVHWGVGADGTAMAKSVGLAGSPQRLADHIQELAELGADSVILNPVGNEREQLDRIVSDVLPELRSLATVQPSGRG